MLLCPECVAKEDAIEDALPSLVVYDDDKTIRVMMSANDKLIQAKEIDSSVQTRSDIFNAETVSIIELRDAIDADDTITNKHFKLGEIVMERMNGYKKAIFEMNEEMVALANKQIANQIYLNELSNKLRLEEREQLKLKDINYKPNPVKVTKPSSASKVRKFDKAELKKWASIAKMPESVIQMLCLAKNLTPEQAAQSFIQASNKSS